MVLSSSGDRKRRKALVKVEATDDFTEDELATLHKKPTRSAPSDQVVMGDACNPLGEPSPLGLTLRKSPSLVDLIQMRLSQSGAAAPVGWMTDLKAGGSVDKLKASNFPATVLRIGTWECLSRYEGDLVAKCYFAKHKIVWEVLDGGLKSKIEIQWSDITALKASCPENGPGTLDIVLARQPLFFRETNPQPRKHTLWQATSDFTGGQASINRRHFLECAPGLLGKHFEKLIQCDPRLNALSQNPEIVLESPYFERRCSIFDDQVDVKFEGFGHLNTNHHPSFTGFHDPASICSAPSSSSKSDINAIGGTETPSPVSGVSTAVVEVTTNYQEENLRAPSCWDNLKVPGLHPSMSMTDLVNRIGNYCSGKSLPGNQLASGNSLVNQNMLDEIAQYLLGDPQIPTPADEKSLMTRVDSLYCLLQNPASIQSFQMNNAEIKDNVCTDAMNEEPAQDTNPMLELGMTDEVGVEDPAPPISRKESVGQLLYLPQITSESLILHNCRTPDGY